jgi:hypothetical protein
VDDSFFVLDTNPAAKKNAIYVRWPLVNDLKLIHSLSKKPDAMVDFP